MMSYMAFSNSTSVASECSSSNGLNKFLKQFNQDNSLQKDRYLQQGENSASSLNRFRSQHHSVISNSNTSLENDFFQEQVKMDKKPAHFFQLQPSLPSFHPYNNEWSQEFHIKNPGSSAVQSTSFDSIYQYGNNINNNWAEQFTFKQSEPFTLECVEEMNSGFQYHNDWQRLNYQSQIPMISRPASSFSSSSASSDTMSEVNYNDWSKEFSKYCNLVDTKEEQLVGASLSSTFNDDHQMEKDIQSDMASNMNDSQYEASKPRKSNINAQILELEAKSQQLPEDAKIWEELGLKQQENGCDKAAITALEKAVSIDATSLNAWLALSISYTNEHCRMDAYRCLKQWIVHNVKYKHIVQQDTTQLFLEAARISPEKLDPDVQIGLGVLFHLSEEFAKAIDCFKAALLNKPDDYLLWNRVGATLANSQDHFGAIEMFDRALEINPLFLRARYNLAVSYMKLGQYREAAEQLLICLDYDNSSDSIWNSLRLLMYMLNRDELAIECNHHNLEAFRCHFDF